MSNWANNGSYDAGMAVFARFRPDVLESIDTMCESALSMQKEVRGDEKAWEKKGHSYFRYFLLPPPPLPTSLSSSAAPGPRSGPCSSKQPG